MKKGFTLTELLIVVAILLILMLILLTNFQTQIMKGNDTKRKTDLAKIQRAFEEFYNDNHCYPANSSAVPPVSPINNCGGSDLSPYMRTVPCDPTTRKPYLFVEGSPTACDGYHVCTQLQNLADPDIKRIGCDPVQGCGWGVGYNYCVTTGGSVVNADGLGGGGGSGPSGGGGPGTPTPTPPAGGQWACTLQGDCNSVSDPSCNPGGKCCPFTYSGGCLWGADNVFQCDTVSNRCTVP